MPRLSEIWIALDRLSHSMIKKRPDLSGVNPEIREYIEALESELTQLSAGKPALPTKPRAAAGLEERWDENTFLASEPETTLCLITLTASFIAKRTQRHLYTRQRRGGMGVFDLETPEDDPPIALVVADEAQNLLLFTNLGRAFRLPSSLVPVHDVRSRGKSVAARFDLLPGEKLAAALLDQAQGAVALVSQTGTVRHLRHHIFGEYMRPGTVLLDANKFGHLAAVCRTSGNADLLIATRRGKAIRFAEKLVPPQGGAGIRLDAGDQVAAVAAVQDESALFMVDAQGNGTVRLMSAFAPNKSAGGGGKLAMKTDQMVAVFPVNEGSDIFLISRLSKVIRFPAEEVPEKEGVVQGVRCMALRADEVLAGIAID
jgi:DNA gyrase subunit A